MLVVAPDFVPVVLGDRWHDTVPVLQLLCLAGIAESVVAMNPSLLVAMGRGGTLLRFTIFSSILTIGGFGVGLIWGLIGVTSFYAATRVIVLPVFTKLACDSIGMAIRDWFRNLRAVAEVSVGMGVVVYVARLGLVHGGVPEGARARDPRAPRRRRLPHAAPVACARRACRDRRLRRRKSMAQAA